MYQILFMPPLCHCWKISEGKNRTFLWYPRCVCRKFFGRQTPEFLWHLRAFSIFAETNFQKLPIRPSVIRQHCQYDFLAGINNCLTRQVDSSFDVSLLKINRTRAHSWSTNVLDYPPKSAAWIVGEIGANTKPPYGKLNFFENTKSIHSFFSKKRKFCDTHLLSFDYPPLE